MGGALVYHIFSKLSISHKACTKPCTKNQTLDFQRFCDFYCAFCANVYMYRNDGRVACKNRASGRVGGGFEGQPKMHKLHKETSQVLDFQRFGVLCNFCASFVQASNL